VIFIGYGLLITGEDMPRQKKVSFNQKLASYDVLIEDTSLDSEYFKVSQFPTGFSGGRNGFLLAGTPFLVPNSRILVEVVNVDGQTIYQEPVKNYTEGNSKLISFEVYENTPPGLYKIILLGQARFYKNGSPIPTNWNEKYNVRWSRDIIVEPQRRNTSPIRFRNQPRIFIEEEKIISIPSTTYVTEIDSGSSISLSAKYESTLPYGYNIKLLSGSTFSKTPEDFKNSFVGVITGSISASANGKLYTSEVNLPLQKIINSNTGESTGSLIVLDSIIETLLLKSGSYVYTSPQSATQYEITSSVQIQYSYVSYNENTVLDTGSYAKLRVVDLGTSTGEVYKTEISYKVPGTSAEYIAVSSPKVTVPEILVSPSEIGDEYWVGTFISGGLHDGAHNTEIHWYAQEMPVSVTTGEYSPATVPTTYFTASDGYGLQLDSSKIINGIYPVVPATTVLDTTSIQPYVFGTKENYTLFASSEYTLRFTALFSAYSGSLKLTNTNDAEVYVYLASTESDRVLETNPLGQLITKIKINPGVEQQYFENVIVNFNPKVLDFGEVSLRFVATNGFWQFSNISIKPAEEFAFNPDETTIIVPNYIDGQTISYAARFFDINGNSTKIEVQSTPITFEGPRKYVKRSGDDMYGELYINQVPIEQQTLESSFTGLLSGGVITINPLDGTKYDVTAGYGYVIDNYTNPIEPTYKLVSWSRFEGITPSGLGVNPRTNIAISASGELYEQPEAFSDRDYRRYIVLGRLAHVGTATIQRVLSLPLTAYNRHFHWYDFVSAITPLNVVGNVYSPSGSSMNIAKSSGETYRIGSNYRIDPTFPDITADTAVNTVTFAYRWRSGSVFAEGPVTTIVTGSLYDNGSGTLQSVQNNRFTVQRIYFFGATNTTRIQFGQNIYNSMADALAAANSEVFVVDSNLAADATFRAFMIVKGDATNLSNPLQATFIPVSQFGAGGGSGGGGASSLSTLTDVTLNTVLNNDVLVYDTTLTEWTNKPITSILPNGTVSASSQVSYTQLSSIPANIVSSSAQVATLLPNGTVSSSTQVKNLLPVGTVSASSQVTYTGLSGIPSGIVSSSTQIPALLPNGTVSASSQVAHNSTTGYVANEHINHTSVSITAGSGLSGGGDISATRTLSVDSGSMLPYYSSSIFGRVSGDVLINSSTGVATIQANSVALGTDTTGNYVSQVTQGRGITVTGVPGEGTNNTILLGSGSAGYNISGSGQWFTVAERIGVNGRGISEVYVYSAGGDLSPQFIKLLWNMDWGGTAQIRVVGNSGVGIIPISNIRATYDTTTQTAQLEVQSSTNSNATIYSNVIDYSTAGNSTTPIIKPTSNFTVLTQIPNAYFYDGVIFTSGSTAGFVGIGTTTPTNRLEVNGSFAATTKSFLIDHPTKPNHKLQYGSLESPYHGIRLTGEGIVKGGKCQIKLPEYIGKFVHEDGINIQLTGVGHNKVLWISDIDLANNTFTVSAKTWFFNRNKYKFFWTFTAVRKDIDKLAVEYVSK
jgi:hypothetical protein